MAVAWKSEQGLHSGKLTVTFRDGWGDWGLVQVSFLTSTRISQIWTGWQIECVCSLQ